MPYDFGTATGITYLGQMIVYTPPATMTNVSITGDWTMFASLSTQSNHQPAVWHGPTVNAIQCDDVYDDPEVQEDRERTVEQYLAATEERRTARQAQDAAYLAASERAKRLLKSVLTPEQWASYVDTDSFHVHGSDGYTYRIENYVSGNVFKLDHDGMDRVRYCAHPDLYRFDDGSRMTLPRCDVLVGQVLALRTDAEGFCRMANIHESWDANGHRNPYPADEGDVVFTP